MNEFRPLILVAEDDDSNFKLIKAIIGKKCDIEWAKNGQEMVELFQQHDIRKIYFLGVVSATPAKSQSNANGY